MKTTIRVCLGIAGLVASMTSVRATAYVLPPIQDAPPVISGLGADVHVTFVFSSAWDQSEAFLGSPSTSLFLNNGGPVFNSFGDVVGVSANPQYSPGYTVDLGVRTGPLAFGIDDLSTGTTFLANSAASDGYFHALYTTDIKQVVPGGLDPTVTAELSALNSETPVLYIAFEDRLQSQGSDFDYNDLIIAVTNVDPMSDPVPEPTSLALLLAGLTGLFLVRRRSRS